MWDVSKTKVFLAPHRRHRHLSVNLQHRKTRYEDTMNGYDYLFQMREDIVGWLNDLSLFIGSIKTEMNSFSPFSLSCSLCTFLYCALLLRLPASYKNVMCECGPGIHTIYENHVHHSDDPWEVQRTHTTHTHTFAHNCRRSRIHYWFRNENKMSNWTRFSIETHFPEWAHLYVTSKIDSDTFWLWLWHVANGKWNANASTLSLFLCINSQINLRKVNLESETFNYVSHAQFNVMRCGADCGACNEEGDWHQTWVNK